MASALYILPSEQERLSDMPAMGAESKRAVATISLKKRKVRVAFADANAHDPGKATRITKSTAATSNMDIHSMLAPDEEQNQLVPTKKRKKSIPKSNASSSPPSPAAAYSNTSPPVSRLSPVVRAKIEAIHAFIINLPNRGPSSLNRDEENPHLVSIAESSVISALMRLRFHFEMGDPSRVSLAEVKVMRRYEEQRTEFAVPCVTIDVSRQTDLEERIKRKIAGTGLEHVRLLVIELEMVKEAEVEWFSRAHCQGVSSDTRINDFKKGAVW